MMDIEKFLEEDIGRGDITSDLLISNEKVKAKIFANEGCIIAGVEEGKKIFESLDLDVKTNFSDGEKIEGKSVVMEIKGVAKSILAGERTALNFLMRMSGIATYTNRLVESCRKINSKIKIAGTRKTTPGFRKWEKKAIRIGGGYPHRYGLYDGVLIKDNHVKIVGDIEECVKRAKKGDKKIEIEVNNIEDALIAANTNVDIIMLDNFKSGDAKKAYEKIKEIDKKIIVEISGGITPENILKYARYADIISLGRLTYSAKAIDFSLKIVYCI